MYSQEALSLQRRMRGFLFAALAASAVAPLNIRDLFSSAKSKMSAGANEAEGATKTIVKKVLPLRQQVAVSAVNPLLAATASAPSHPPPGAIACALVRMVGKPAALRFSEFKKSIGVQEWGVPE